MTYDFDEFDDRLEELAADLRQATERELRWEAEDVESDVDQGRRRRRDLSLVAYELMSKGDEVSAGWGHTIVTGRIVYVRGDLAVVETGHAVVSLNLSGPVVIKVVERATSGGIGTPSGGSGTFKARLAELEQTGETIRVVSTHSEELIEGRVTVAARDHIALTNRQGTEWFVPHQVIAMVIQPVNQPTR